MSFSSDINSEMHSNEPGDEAVEEILQGTAVPGYDDISTLMHQVRETYSQYAPAPVGAELSEFVDVKLAADPGGAVSTTVDVEVIEPSRSLIDLSSPLDVRSTRRSTVSWKKISASVVAAGAGVLFLASIASAGSTLDDGDYTLVLPGIGDFEFTIDSDGDGDTVIAVAAPDGYAIDDDDPAKAAWKDAASVEVEIKTDKIEGDYDWSGGDAELTLPDGGSISVTPPAADGSFSVDASGGWWAFGSGRDWIVANAAIIGEATEFFKIEATADGIEIKPVDGPGDGFLNDLDDEEEEEEESEVEESESEGDNNGNANGRGKSDD